MKFCAIRHIPTGYLVPAGGKGLGGHTKQSPSPTRPPRLSETRASAKRALSAYLKGEWKDFYRSTGEWGEPEWDGTGPARGTERKAADFDTVLVELKVAGA